MLTPAPPRTPSTVSRILDASAPRPSASRTVIPFLTTRPVDDVALAFALLPVWWALGLEQLVWLPVSVWAALKTVMSRDRIRVPMPLVLLLAAGLPVLASVGGIEEPTRFVTYGRSLWSYASFVAIAFVIANGVRSRGDGIRLLRGLAIGIGVNGLLGLLAITGVLRPSFLAPVADLILPDALATTDLGRRFVERSLGGPGWFAPIGSYFRVSGLFLFSTMHAAALASSVPLIALAVRVEPVRTLRYAWLVALGLSVVNLGFTTGRTAIVALAFGFAVFLMHTLTARRTWIPRLVGIAVVAVTVSVASVVAITQPLDAVGASILEARGSSTSDRLRIYRVTVAEVLERPLTGWGTERDRPGLPYPAGSHSTYLGVLYKHGAIALLLLIGAGVAAWSSARRLEAEPRDHRRWGRYVRWSLATMALVAMTDVLDLDATTFAVAAIVFGLALVRMRPEEPGTVGSRTSR